MYQTNIPKLSHLLTMLAPLAILFPPLPVAPALGAAPAGADPCASLTPAAFQQITDKVAESLAKAESDVSANGKTGNYASAAVTNRGNLAEVHKALLELQSSLKKQGFDTPFVTNTSTAYSIHNIVREELYKLHQARHWATISVVNHKSSDAFDSYNLTSEAIDLAEALGAQAGRCYMRSYFPSTSR